MLTILPGALDPVRGYLETWVQDRVGPDSVQVPGGMLDHCGCPLVVIGVALIWPASLPGTARGEARKGFAQLEVAVPSSPGIYRDSEEENLWA